MRNVTARVLGLIVMASMLTTAVAQQSVSAAPQTGVKAKLVKGGLNDPAAFTFGPGGLIYYLERATGRVITLNPKNDHEHVVFTIPGVNGDDERGALGIALHPSWPKVPYIYVFVTRTFGTHAKPIYRNQLIRIRVKNGHGVGFHVYFQVSASAAGYHNGGRILFGPGGDLFIFIGDAHVDGNAQDRTANLHGKMLRIHADGSVPKTNPFKGSRIWTYGNRNSFGFTFDPRNGRLWQTENGPGCNDEVNLLVRGANYGWGAKENCSGSSPGDTNNSGTGIHFPKTFFPSPIGITGDAFCNHCGLPARFEGHLFFGCVNDAKLRVVGLNPARNDISTGPTALFTAQAGIDSMETAPNRAIYFSTADGIYRLVMG